MIKGLLSKIRTCHLRINNEARATTTLAKGHQGRLNSKGRSLRTIKTRTTDSHMMRKHTCNKTGPCKTLLCNAAPCRTLTRPAWVPMRICLEGHLCEAQYLSRARWAACLQAPHLADKLVAVLHLPDLCIQDQCHKDLCIQDQHHKGPCILGP